MTLEELKAEIQQEGFHDPRRIEIQLELLDRVEDAHSRIDRVVAAIDAQLGPTGHFPCDRKHNGDAHHLPGKMVTMAGATGVL